MARRRFLPALRGQQHPAAHDTQLKVVLGDYYGALASAGVWNSSRSRPWPVERAVAEGYERIIYVFRSVEAIAGQASRLPFRLKQGEDVVDDHPLYAILNKQANPMETGRQFRKRLCSQILLSKRGAFVQVTTARSGTPLRMDLLPPGRTRPVPGAGISGARSIDNPDPDVLIDHYEVVRADGSRAFIPAEQVRWFREPHPLDPYSGVTPLEAAGMSAELDFFARLYNVQFLKNDARPGGVLAINGDMDPDDMDRIERKFGRGPAEAGKLTVIAGDVSYVDSVVRPRDMQYLQMAGNAKTEILTAFGVPESVLGYAADRTYANAGQEHENFWVITMPPYLDLMATGLDDLSDPDLEGFFDVSQVEALQAAEAAKRAEKREEFKDGLIILDEYREAVGMDPLNTPASRCLYVPATSVAVPTSDADKKELGGNAFIAIAQATGSPAAAGPGGPPGPAPAGEITGGGGGAPGVHGGEGGGSGTGGTSTAETKSAVAAAGNGHGAPRRLRLIQSCQVKALPLGDGDESAPDEAAHAQLEAALAAALTALTRRWAQRTLARLTSPKMRKGTRHWEPDLRYKQDQRMGTTALDASGAVDGDRWQDEAQDTAAPIIMAAALAAGAALAADLAPGPANPAVTAAAGDSAGAVVSMIGAAAAGLAAKVTAAVNEADQSGAPMTDITDTVRQVMDRETADWGPAVAAQAATAVIAGARDGAAQAVADTDPAMEGKDIVRVWRTRRDDRVRATHRATDGETQPLGTPFLVGDSLLRYPGDPLGPPGEVYNCRCHLNHKAVSTGRFVATPPGELTRAAGRVG